MDLDDEELKATRMMNGADRKGRINKMEQDINELIEELTKVRPDELSTEGLKLFNKINDIIDKNKELEEKNKKKSIEIICYQEELENSIPVSLVEETIEEKKQEKNKFGNCLVEFYENELADRDIKILQELLEGRK